LEVGLASFAIWIVLLRSGGGSLSSADSVGAI
jgi:hypothetical protein